MKNTILLLLFSTILIFSCGKSGDKPSNQLPSKAETKPQYDNTSFGVYKGVIIGSSGYIVFRINNGDNTSKGELTIDDRKDILSTTQTITAAADRKCKIYRQFFFYDSKRRSRWA